LFLRDNLRLLSYLLRVKRRSSSNQRTLQVRSNLPPSGTNGPLAYHSRESLLTPGEAPFYRFALLPALGQRYTLLVKVRLTDVISCDDRLWDRAVGRRIRQRHLDFVLATKKTLRIVAAIHLDDASHDRPKQREIDDYLDDALRAAGIPSIRVRATARYDPKEIAREVNRLLRLHVKAARRRSKSV